MTSFLPFRHLVMYGCRLPPRPFPRTSSLNARRREQNLSPLTPFQPQEKDEALQWSPFSFKIKRARFRELGVPFFPLSPFRDIGSEGNVTTFPSLQYLSEKREIYLPPFFSLDLYEFFLLRALVKCLYKGKKCLYPLTLKEDDS